MMGRVGWLVALACVLHCAIARDEDKIMKACYWPNELYEPCFGGCAEVSCDNPRNHLRPCYPYCEPGCVCEEPYVRDDRTHQCVLPQDCSPTQMGIPVPAKRGGGPKPSAPSGPPPGSGSGGYEGRLPQRHYKRSDGGEVENELPSHPDEYSKRGSEMSRMGNYFNIVIAPPPIKALQPRKLLATDAYRTPPKRYSAQ